MNLLELSPFEYVVIVLAAFRITRFFVFDSLIGANPNSGSKFAIWLDVFAYDQDGTDRGWLRGKIGDLLSCPFCMGFWISLATLSVWYADWFGGWARAGVVVWAVAGAAAIFSQWDIAKMKS